MRLFGIIGYPLSHSFSRLYFSEKFLREGHRDCRYELFPITEIGALPSLLADHPELEGLNVTIPYKEQVLPFLQHSHLPEGLPACNCIRIRNGELSGFNTDHLGFEKSLATLLKSWHTRAMVLGSGGAARAVCYSLRQMGIGYEIVGREQKGEVTLTYAELKKEHFTECRLIVNTTPVGMYPHVNDRPAIPYHYLDERHLLYDLVYNPPLTLFLQKGQEMGATVKNGEEMLVLQAEENWKIWNE